MNYFIIYFFNDAFYCLEEVDVGTVVGRILTKPGFTYTFNQVRHKTFCVQSIVNLESLISVSNMSTFKLENKCLIPSFYSDFKIIIKIQGLTRLRESQYFYHILVTLYFILRICFFTLFSVKYHYYRCYYLRI